MLDDAGTDGHLRALGMDQVNQRIGRHRPELAGEFADAFQQLGRPTAIFTRPRQGRFADTSRERRDPLRALRPIHQRFD